MHRQLHFALATLLLTGSITNAETSPERPQRDRYTTIQTVIRVGSDVDALLDERDRITWARPVDLEKRISQLAPAQTVDSRESMLDSINWALVDWSQVDNRQGGLDLLTLTTEREIYQDPGLRRGRAETFARDRSSELQELDEKFASFSLEDLTAGWTPLMLNRPEPIAWQAPQLQDFRSLSDPARFNDFGDADFEMLASTSATRSPSDLPIRAASPLIVAAATPQSTTAENAGLGLFLTLMIAPFAWLGWQEYQDLKSRSRTVDLRNLVRSVMDRDEQERLEEELRDLDIQVQSDIEAETTVEVEADTEDSEQPVFTEIAAEDDCEYELGVLDEANSLLATAGQAREEAAERAEREARRSDRRDTTTEASDELTMIRGLGASTRNHLAKNGIRTLADLEDAGEERLREILDRAGEKFRTARPDQWIEQAREILATAR